MSLFSISVELYVHVSELVGLLSTHLPLHSKITDFSNSGSKKGTYEALCSFLFEIMAYAFCIPSD